jgi:hypothetical protein
MVEHVGRGGRDASQASTNHTPCSWTFASVIRFIPVPSERDR